MKALLSSRLAKLAVAFLLLAALYRAADWSQVAAVLSGLDMAWLTVGLVLFLPQTIVSAWRWQRLVQELCSISLRESLRQTLAASALNLVAPSKLGDLSKAAMLSVDRKAEKGKACGLVAIEKCADVAALASFLLLGCFGSVDLRTAVAVAAALVIIAWSAVARTSLVGRVVTLALTSAVLWFLHLAQIDCFLRAAGVATPWTVSFARIPVAIFAGLLPISFCGVGTRDAALVWLFADVASPATMAGVGLLTALRYLVPGVLGIPCLHQRPCQPVDAVSIASLGEGQPA